MQKWQMWTVAAVVVVAVGVGCLFGGKAWGSSSSSGGDAQFPGNGNGAAMGRGDGSMPSGGFGGRNGGGAVSGNIIAADADSITVKTSDGSTKMILVGASATVSLVTQGSTSDLTTGTDVVVIGTTNTDGTVTATSIRIGDTLAAGAGAPPADGVAPSASGTATTQTTTK